MHATARVLVVVFQGFLLVSAGTLTARAASDEDTAPAAGAAREKATGDSHANGKNKPTVDVPTTEAAEKILADKGLKLEDRRYSLDEAQAVEKFRDIKQLHQELQKATAKCMAIAEYDDMVMSMMMQQQALQAQASSLQAQINRANAGAYGRMRRLVNAQVAPLRQQETMMKNQISQMTQQLNAMKTGGPKTTDRQNAPVAYEKARQELIEAVKSLEPLVVPLINEYHELGLDATVTAAMNKLRHASNKNYKLGPSDDLLAASRLLKELKLMPKHFKHVGKSKSR